MRRIKLCTVGFGFLFAGLVSQATPARADAVEDFYKGRTVNLYIGYRVGGAYDFYARQIARYLGSHIPGNPTVVS